MYKNISVEVPMKIGVDFGSDHYSTYKSRTAIVDLQTGTVSADCTPRDRQLHALPQRLLKAEIELLSPNGETILVTPSELVGHAGQTVTLTNCEEMDSGQWRTSSITAVQRC